MHPVLLHIPREWFGFELNFYSYGFMLFLGLAAGWHLIVHLAPRDGFDAQRMGKYLFYVIIASLAGARVAAVATSWGLFAPSFPVSLVNFKISGMVAYGGFLGGLAAVVALSYTSGWNVWRFFDVVSLSGPLGLGITRLGCFLAGCCFGKATDSPLGVSFPKGSIPYAEQVHDHLIDASAPSSLPVVPTQLIESLFGFVLFGFLYWIQTRKRRFAGETVAFFFLFYGLFRFGIEFVRADTVRGFVGPISTSQFIGLLTVPVAAAVLLYFYKKGYTLADTAPPPEPAPKTAQKKKTGKGKKRRG